MSKTIRLSVRNLVEFSLRSGDIDNSFMSTTRALEGTMAHQKLQKSYGAEYSAEVYLKHDVEYEDYTILLEGRADGIIDENEYITIDEIKSTTRDLEDIDENYNPMHWAQAKCYGYIYAVQNHLDEIYIQLSYFHLESEEVKKFKKRFSKEELEEFFDFLIDKYISWASITFDWLKIRDESIASLPFPFKNYRNGQREMAVATYGTIKERKNLFAQAPTGIGKTMSSIYPSIKSIGEGLATKIFYLTAKTITREVPKSSMDLLMNKGLRAKVLIITAKDKICSNDEVKCNPRDCKAAKGHYDRVNEAIKDIFINEDMMDRDKVLSYAHKHNVCPFEFSLDASLWSDVIICDYNYVFDPQVYLRRFFEVKNEDYVLLIDEAHNLVDRSREMFSASLKENDIADIKHIFKEKHPAIYKSLNKIVSILDKLEDYFKEENYFYQSEEIQELYFPLKKIITILDPWLMEEKNHEDYDSVMDLYFNINSFLKIAELYDEHYVTYLEKDWKSISIKQYCVDPSYLLSQALNRGRAAIFFSATLTPLDYHRSLLGGKEDDYYMRLSSPFPKENLKLLINGTVSTRYVDRIQTYSEVINNIKSFIHGKLGNYFVFFPSYKYMEDIYEHFVDLDLDFRFIIQKGNMSEIEREEFLNIFNEETNVVAFAVMGGIFSEGIDLIGDKLIGAVIVGVGLPQICLERDIIKDYFNHNLNEGFEYAYVYPGMNKVLQAAGRVIRSENDRGAILLIDDRYNTKRYKELFPREWSHYERIWDDKELLHTLIDFWE